MKEENIKLTSFLRGFEHFLNVLQSDKNDLDFYLKGFLNAKQIYEESKNKEKDIKEEKNVKKDTTDIVKSLCRDHLGVVFEDKKQEEKKNIKYDKK